MKYTFRKTQLSIALTSIFIALTAHADYIQGQEPIATLDAGEVVAKSDTITQQNAGETYSQTINRSGNPVRIIWYGRAGEADGEIPQTGANNQGFIRASVTGTGTDTNDKLDLASTVIAEGMGNGIDALGYSAHTNPNSVEIQLDSIENQRLIQASTSLESGKALLHGSTKSYATGNGISLASSVDWGEGSVDGYSGATNSGKSPSGVAYREQRTTETSDATLAHLATPKNAQISLQSLNNQGTITGKIETQGASYDLPDPDPMTSDNIAGYTSKPTASGNGVSLVSHVFTPKDAGWRGQKSDQNHNKALLNQAQNHGLISGTAFISGGSGAKETYVYAEAVGNGISVAALSNNNPLPDSSSGYALNQTEASLGTLDNHGRILGNAYLHAQNNSNHRKIKGSDASAVGLGSGNGVSVYAESTQSQAQSTKALLGNIANTGQIQGQIELQAGNGTGYQDAEARGSGNALLAYASLFSPSSGKGTASIGNISNQGTMTGSIIAKPGISSYGTVTVSQLEPLKIIVADTQNPRNKALHLPATPKDSTVTSGMADFRTDNTAFASGNGITAFVGEKSSDKYGATLGNIDNRGVISGYAELYHGFKSGGSSKGYQDVRFALVGSGIAIDSPFQSALDNLGIVSGNHAALMAEGNTGFSTSNPNYNATSANAYTGNINNYGLMAGTMILGTYHHSADHSTISQTMSQPYRYYEQPNRPANFQNLGTLVKLKVGAEGDSKTTTRHDDDQTIQSIEHGAGGKTSINGTDYTIINGTLHGTDSQHETTESALQNVIVNGIGMDKGALVVSQDLNLENSYVNGLVTALKLEGDLNLTAKQSALNTNGFIIKGSDPKKHLALLGDDGEQSALFAGTSFLNGNLDFGAGDDQLTIDDASVKMNGRFIDMNDGEDTLTLGNPSNTEAIKIDYAILNAENLKLEGKTHFTAAAQLRGTKALSLNSDVVYEVNSPTEHAWYDDTSPAHDMTISGTGRFLIDADRVFGKQNTDRIDFGKVELIDGSDQTTFVLANNALLDMKIEDGDLVMGKRPTATAPTTPAPTTPSPTTPAPSTPVVTTPAPTTPSNPFVTPYPDAYNSYLNAWQNGGSHFLKNTAAIHDKTLKSAEAGVNAYLQQVVEQNIYATVPHVSLSQLNTQSALDFGQRGLLAQGQWSLSPQLLHHQNQYRHAAKQSALSGVQLHARYGVGDALTVGVQLAASREQVRGQHDSKLKGTGQYFGAYANTGSGNTLWRTGFMLGQSALDATRIADNTFDRTQTTARIKPQFGKVYTRLETSLPLSETLQFAPHAEVSYQWLKQSAFVEQGDGALGFDVYRYGSVGADVGAALRYDANPIQAEFSLAYQARKAGKDWTARFVRGSNFAIKTEDQAQGLSFGAALRYQASNHLTWRIGVKAGQRQTQAYAGFDYSF